MLFPVWSTGSTNPHKKEGDVSFNGNEHSAEHPESTVNLSLSSSAPSGEQDDITKKRDKERVLLITSQEIEISMNILTITLKTAAPRAWYETLANYLLENSFHRGKIDQTLFIKTQKGDILLVQIYVDDIIFGVTNKDLCKSFEKLMKDKFQMSSMGELTFFLGLQ
nr:putative ribonuclease H-like domain-containing protein [Tanacetum cinerariifolium]